MGAATQVYINGSTPPSTVTPMSLQVRWRSDSPVDHEQPSTWSLVLAAKTRAALDALGLRRGTMVSAVANGVTIASGAVQRYTITRDKTAWLPWEATLQCEDILGIAARLKIGSTPWHGWDTVRTRMQRIMAAIAASQPALSLGFKGWSDAALPDDRTVSGGRARLCRPRDIDSRPALELLRRTASTALRRVVATAGGVDVVPMPGQAALLVHADGTVTSHAPASLSISADLIDDTPRVIDSQTAVGQVEIMGWRGNPEGGTPGNAQSLNRATSIEERRETWYMPNAYPTTWRIDTEAATGWSTQVWDSAGNVDSFMVEQWPPGLTDWVAAFLTAQARTADKPRLSVTIHDAPDHMIAAAAMGRRAETVLTITDLGYGDFPLPSEDWWIVGGSLKMPEQTLTLDLVPYASVPTPAQATWGSIPAALTWDRWPADLTWAQLALTSIQGV